VHFLIWSKVKEVEDDGKKVERSLVISIQKLTKLLLV